MANSKKKKKDSTKKASWTKYWWYPIVVALVLAAAKRIATKSGEFTFHWFQDSLGSSIVDQKLSSLENELEIFTRIDTYFPRPEVVDKVSDYVGKTQDGGGLVVIHGIKNTGKSIAFKQAVLDFNRNAEKAMGDTQLFVYLLDSEDEDLDAFKAHWDDLRSKLKRISPPDNQKAVVIVDSLRWAVETDKDGIYVSPFGVIVLRQMKFLTQTPQVTFIILTSDPYHHLFDEGNPGTSMFDAGRKSIQSIEETFGKDIFLLNDDEAQQVFDLNYDHTLRKCPAISLYAKPTLEIAQPIFKQLNLDSRRIGHLKHFAIGTICDVQVGRFRKMWKIKEEKDKVKKLAEQEEKEKEARKEPGFGFDVSDEKE